MLCNKEMIEMAAYYEKIGPPETSKPSKGIVRALKRISSLGGLIVPIRSVNSMTELLGRSDGKLVLVLDLPAEEIDDILSSL